MRRAALGFVALMSACAQKPPAATALRAGAPGVFDPDFRVPPFAGYEPFSRAAVVAIARREWRLFGSPVDDDFPDTRPPTPADQKPERVEGLWQRVGEYWWFGLPQSAPEAAWTGKHDASGATFPAGDDGSFAWSAAFVGYVMRIAGAGSGFPYSATHARYINAAVRGTPNLVVAAERPSAYAPVPGDLICHARGRSASLTYDDLPAAFPGHCDIVVGAASGQLTVIGGNVDDAVTMKHVPVTEAGRLAEPDGRVRDARYPWMIVLRLVTPAAVPAAVPVAAASVTVVSR